MDTIIDIVLPGEPVGKGRPRFNSQSKRTYTPQKTMSYESMVKGYAYEAMGGREPITGPVSVIIEAYFTVPQSKSMKAADRRLAEAERLPVIKKPDGDNIAKIILDPMNAIVFRDDSQAWSINVVKMYSPSPRVRVRVLA